MRGVGRYASAGRWRDLASRPSSRPLVSLCGPFDFPRIGLRADVVRRFCQLVFITRFARLRSSSLVSVRHSLAAEQIVFPFVSSLVSLFRLVGASRDYSLRFACQSVSSRRFAGVSLFRLARRSVSCSSVLLVVSRCLVLPGLSSPLVSLGFSLSSPCSLVSLGGSSRRLVGRGVSSVIRLSFRSLFCSRIISLVAVSWPWRRRLVLSPVSWRRCVGGMVVSFDDTGDAPFLSARFPLIRVRAMTI